MNRYVNLSMIKKFLVKLILLFSLINFTFAKDQREFVIETDMGIDDAIAILYLLMQPNIKIRAIVIEGNGLTHCKYSLRNLKGLLSLLHKKNIPYACAENTLLTKGHKMAKAVRQFNDQLGGMSFRNSILSPKESAYLLLKQILETTHQPIEILAIAPLTSLAKILTKEPLLKHKIRKIYIMGGALFVPGNLSKHQKPYNKFSEVNFYIDPSAVYKIFYSGIPIVLIPLDVTNQVMLDQSFYQQIKNKHHTLASYFMYQLLRHNHQMIKDRQWYFWDPLAAVIAVHLDIAQIKTFPLMVVTDENNAGRVLVNKEKGVPIQTVLHVKKLLFYDILLQGLN